jgi:hypothetical protein
VLRLDPSFKEAWVNAGQAARELGNARLAEEKYGKVLCREQTHEERRETMGADHAFILGTVA